VAGISPRIETVFAFEDNHVIFLQPDPEKRLVAIVIESAKTAPEEIRSETYYESLNRKDL